MFSKYEIAKSLFSNYGYVLDEAIKDYNIRLDDYVFMSKSNEEIADRIYYDIAGQRRRNSYILTTMCSGYRDGDPEQEAYFYYGLNYDKFKGGLSSLTSEKIKKLNKEVNSEKTKSHGEISYTFDNTDDTQIAAPIFAYPAAYGDLESIQFDIVSEDGQIHNIETLKSPSTSWRKTKLFVNGVEYNVYLGQYTCNDKNKVITYNLFN